jgi:hypothetical protein
MPSQSSFATPAARAVFVGVLNARVDATVARASAAVSHRRAERRGGRGALGAGAVKVMSGVPGLGIDRPVDVWLACTSGLADTF